MNYKHKVGKTLLASACALATTTAAAGVLEEIVVTATKRSQSIQDIPMSVQALSGDTLVDRGINDFSEMSASVPNLNIGTGLSNTFVNVRGMGSGNDRAFEQSVGLFVDDVYMPRGSHYRTAFMDVDRVEVLRGSQAVLFGLNSTAGAISVHSKKNRPGDELEGYARLSYEGEYEKATLEGAIGGSLSDTFALRFAFKTSEGENYYENINTGESVGDTEFDAFRLSAVFTPSDNLTIEAKAESLDNYSGGVNVSVFSVSNDWLPQNPSENNTPGNFAASAGAATVLVPGANSGKSEFGFWEEATNASVKIIYDTANGGAMTAFLAYSDIESDINTDLLFSPAADWAAPTIEDYEQTSAEIRYASAADSDFSYIAGLYYHTAEITAGADNFFDLAAFGVPIGNVFVASGYAQDTDLISPFATGTWNVSDKIRTTLGVRYVSEDKDYNRYASNATDTGGVINSFLPPITPAPDTDAAGSDGTYSPWLGGPDLLAAVIGFAARSDGFAAKRSSNNFMAELLVQLDISDDNMAYLKVGNSAKSGGFGSGVQAQPETLPFEDEEAKTIEVGLKSSMLDGAAELNVAAFYTQYDDLQVNSFNAQGDPSITNASSSTSTGLELDGRWAVNDWFLLSGSLAFLDAEFDDFLRGPGTADGVTRPANSDYSGLDRPFAAAYSGNLAGDISVPISDSINFVGGLNVSFSDDYFTEGSIDPAGKQDSWVKVDARVGVQSADESWRVMLVGNNLTDELTTNSYQFFISNNLAFLSPPRTYTLSAEYRF
ncbi:MAG: TonB-dependent receptor [Pseudomonadales bacterium]